MDRFYLMPGMLAALAAAILHLSGLFQSTDGGVFDRLSVRGTAEEPAVTLIRLNDEVSANALVRASLALGAERVVFLSDPGSDLDRLAPGERERTVIGFPAPRLSGRLPSELLAAARRQKGELVRTPIARPVAEYGIHRSQNAWIESEEGEVALLEPVAAGREPSRRTYYIPMPRSLSFAQLSSDQLVSADFVEGDLEGMTVIVARPEELSGNLLTTPISPNLAAVSRAQFAAYAVQALAAGREATKPGNLAAVLLILFAAMLSALAAILLRKRHISAAIALSLCVFAGIAGWIMLEAAGVILPFGAIWTAVALAWLGTIMFLERRKDSKLESSVVGAIEQTISHTAFSNRDNLPALLVATAEMVGIERMLLVRTADPLSPNPPATFNAEISDFAGDVQGELARLASRLAEGRSLPVRGLLSDWPGQVRLRAIGYEDKPLYWLYTFGDSPDAELGEYIAANLAQSFVTMQKLHASLSAQQRGRRAVDPVDFRVVSAIGLISRNSRQLRKAIDQLNSSVMAFDVVGFPLHASPQMVDLLEASGMNPHTALLSEIIENLTELTKGQVEALLRDILREGGEASAPMRQIAGVSATLRVSCPDPARASHESIVVLEAFDTSDLARLYDLRGAITDFIDVQMRNDLETIALAAALAKKAVGDKKRGKRMIERIVAASQAATDRLNAMNDLARNQPVSRDDMPHPIQLRSIAENVGERLADFAGRYDVQLDFELPAVSGYSVGDPLILARMFEALLRLVITDSPQHSAVTFSLAEDELRSAIEISGGFGMDRARLRQAIANPPRHDIPEFLIVSESARTLSSWGGEFAYDSETGKGYTFQLSLRRIA
ncbi:hypothetical protein K3165_11555 [Qipengyuania sp. 1XM1-15A]|uniref:hypothetical protein n=1 Tax=Qipengyuania xiamenensis TaxID=2867237 RepID=UPI001C86E6E5|nr:hypothetical protein [Qipengyuania xiamenensis]MBX7533559.1 hypothetical protein [Qipengyuania xiamenensis]